MSNNIGVYQLENGFWGYRFTRMVDGKRVNKKGTKDETGKPIKTEISAVRARNLAMKKFDFALNQKQNGVNKPLRKTFKEIYDEYCEKGRSGKAYATIKKQESLWNNHISANFGNCYIDELSLATINDYLTDLYYVEGRAYSYVESFLKMFYLIYGQAYTRNYIDVNLYNKYCVNKDTKIKMPKMKADEDTDIKIFSQEELELLDEYFNGSNAETAYLLGRYCGLRINECYGLKWDNVDLEKGTLRIDRQMQYQEGIIKLVPLKTHNSKRTIYMSENLKAYFIELKAQRDKYETELLRQREQNKKMISDINGEMISSLELVNSLPNGKIQTINSMKYHSRTIKSSLNIGFKFHYLRHTYGTRLAELNTPVYILCKQMGHASSKVTEKYYLAVSKRGIDVLQNNLNQL